MGGFLITGDRKFIRSFAIWKVVYCCSVSFYYFYHSHFLNDLLAGEGEGEEGRMGGGGALLTTDLASR